jgi:hypothetical protein
MSDQANLFGEIIKKPKPRTCCYNNDNSETFDELERRVASQYGRRHIGWPCDDAQDLHIDDRPQHIKNCKECERLMIELEKKVGIR